MSSISSISGSNLQTTMTQRQPSAKMQEKMLAKMDTDGSGGISQSEFQTAVDHIASKTGVTASQTAQELFSTADSDGNGNLSATELGGTMQSVLPPPPSTVAFAQSRSAETSSSASDSDSDKFAELDTDGNGSLSQAEFEAGAPKGANGPKGPPPAGGMGPPPPAGGAQDSATTDPLDTNADGVVSAAERAAGEAQTDPLQALMDTIDANSDGQLSTAEVDGFVKQLASLLENAAQQYSQTASGTSSASSTGSVLSTQA